MAKAGRKSKYETMVKPRFSEIKDWCTCGASDKEIIQRLGIGRSNFYKYLNDHLEFRDFLKECRKSPIEAIKAALFKRACGYDYIEKKVIVSEKDGERVERIYKHLPADPACAMILLKHWAKDEGWTNDPQMLEIKKQELELKKQEAQKNNW